MKTVQAGRQVFGDNPQEVAGHGEDLQVVRSIEHVVRKPCVSQLVVMEVHRPESHDKEYCLVQMDLILGKGVTCTTHVYTFLPQFWFMAERVGVDFC